MRTTDTVSPGSGTNPGAHAQILTGHLVHWRRRPVSHRFAYRLFYLCLPLRSLESQTNRLFALNRFNVLSLHFRDHGPRDGTHPLPWVRALLAREGLALANGEIWLQCFPRLFGFVFNPVSFWFCHDESGELRAVLAEVNNTFGEHHCYLLAHPDARPIGEHDNLNARKVFHVSPFFPVSGSYRFRFRNAAASRTSRIDYGDDDGVLLVASLSGRAKPLSTRSALAAVASHPFMTFAVIARIHWQALRLFIKRVPFFSKPAPPAQDLTR